MSRTRRKRTYIRKKRAEEGRGKREERSLMQKGKVE